MNLRSTSSVDIANDDDVRRARHLARDLSQQAGFDQHQEVRLVTIVSELTRNILKYANSGTCNLELLVDPRISRIRCVCRDNGPGIADTAAALTDGYSTSSTLGVGLPGAKRLADAFHLSTSADGTTVEAEVHTRERVFGAHGSAVRSLSDTTENLPQIGISIRPFHHGRFSGDQAGVWLDDDYLTACIVDGLGHGEDAEFAALKAIRFVEENRAMEPAELMQACDKKLVRTRGAAVGLARIERASGLLKYVGVGNPRCALVNHQIAYLGSVSGVVGDGGFTPFLRSCQLEDHDVIMLWTDGLPESIRMVPMRIRRLTNAQAHADQMIDQHASKDDDAGMVVIRWDGLAQA